MIRLLNSNRSFTGYRNPKVELTVINKFFIIILFSVLFHVYSFVFSFNTFDILLFSV